jgi:hypothetical protein
MKVRIEIDEQQLRSLVMRELESKLGSLEFEEADVKIEVKSKQNWKSEWESAEFRAVVEVTHA